MDNKKSGFSWTKLYLFKTLTEKPSEKSAGSIVIVLIILGIFILRLPWWLCVILIVISIWNIARAK